MPTTLKKKNKSTIIIRAQCPYCDKYKAVFHYRITKCSNCGYEFPFEVKTMMDDMEDRINFYIGEFNATATY